MIRFILIICLIGALIRPLDGQAKIVGGRQSSIARAPFAASLMHRNTHYCGGSLIGVRTIVTAAHCVVSYKPKDLSVRVGSNYRLRGGTVVQVAGWKRHPSYKHKTLNYDLALVYLQKPLNFTRNVQPIELYTKKLKRNGKAKIFGWGAPREKGRNVNNLQAAALRVYSRKRCKKAYGKLLKRTMYCAGAGRGARDACQGDSGGPLVIDGRLAGIISVGSGCGRRGFPGIYTKVPLLRRWILNNS